MSRSVGPRRLVSGVVVLLAAVLGWPAGGGGATATAAAASSMSDPSVSWGSWIDDLTEQAIQAHKNFVEARIILSNAQTAVLTPAQRAEVAQKLNDSLDRINTILDPLAYPSLDPASIATIESTIDPDTLEKYANTSVTLAQAALDEVAAGPGFDQDLFGSLLVTIKHLLTRSDPHNYFSVAGSN